MATGPLGIAEEADLSVVKFETGRDLGDWLVRVCVFGCGLSVAAVAGRTDVLITVVSCSSSR